LMFTGIISDVGHVVDIRRYGSVITYSISSSYDPSTIALGASIAHSGVCLTVTHVEAHEDGALYRVDVSPETLERTTCGGWGVGQALNLERALHLGDELGGHMVLGHVDGVGQILARSDVFLPSGLDGDPDLGRSINDRPWMGADGPRMGENGPRMGENGPREFDGLLAPYVGAQEASVAGDVVTFSLELPKALHPFVAEKGSLALDGISLTVNKVTEAGCEVMLIPHTLAHTTWGQLGAGQAINVEIDPMARYAERLLQFR
jgi:riboflavin synthase